jgi:hypothetical protein
MMRTEQLTNNEIYQLVGEAYSAYYLSKGWLRMLIKRYTNPFGNYNWMGRNVPRFAKTVIKSGREMLLSMGMSQSIISDEMKDLMKQAKNGNQKLSQKANKIKKEVDIITITKNLQKPVKIVE